MDFVKKVMNLKLNLLILLNFTCYSPWVEADERMRMGGANGGGGDASEMRVDEIRADILNWIHKGGASYFTYFGSLNEETYRTAMVPILKRFTVQISFVSTEEELQTNNPERIVSVEGRAKTCRGFFSVDQGAPVILCNIERFNAASEDAQYRLVHHEFAGLVGIENNQGSHSDYTYSNQISSFLEYQLVKKLVVKSPNPEDENPAPLTLDEEEEQIDLHYFNGEHSNQLSFEWDSRVFSRGGKKDKSGFDWHPKINLSYEDHEKTDLEPSVDLSLELGSLLPEKYEGIQEAYSRRAFGTLGYRYIQNPNSYFKFSGASFGLSNEGVMNSKNDIYLKGYFEFNAYLGKHQFKNVPNGDSTPLGVGIRLGGEVGYQFDNEFLLFGSVDWDAVTAYSSNISASTLTDKRMVGVEFPLVGPDVKMQIGYEKNQQVNSYNHTNTVSLGNNQSITTTTREKNTQTDSGTHLSVKYKF